MAMKNATEFSVVADYVDICVPPRIRTMGVWAAEEVIIPSGPFTGYKFDTDRLPYSGLLLDEIGKWQRHVITGPTQSGKSFHAFVLVIMYHLFERREDVIVGVPDINMAADKWTEDIKPVIEKSRYNELLPTFGSGSKGAAKLQKVTFGNGCFLRFMSAGGNDKQRAGATARVLIVTETDGLDMVAETSQEGQTKIAQLEGRIRAYGDEAASFFECTVSTDEAYTWKNYKAGTASIIKHQCHACESWVSPERENLVCWQDEKNEIDAGESGRFSCPECGVLYSEDDRFEMNKDPRLIHRGQAINKKGEITGDPPKTHTLGFRWSAFQNLLVSTKQLASEEWAAANSDDPELANITRQQQAWAMPAKNQNIERVPIDANVVRGSHPSYIGRCSGIERGEIPEGAKPLTCFIDIAKRTLQWSVECEIDRRIHVVDYGFFKTESPDIIGAEMAISDGIIELTNQIEEKYPTLNLGLVDCGNWRETVTGTVNSINDTWRVSKGLSQKEHYRHPPKTTDDKVIPVDGCRLWYWKSESNYWIVNFNTDALKHKVHAGFQVKPLGENKEYVRDCITIFGSEPRIHTEYAKQIMAEEFIREFKIGQGFVGGWKQHKRDNHMLDCSAGNILARLVCKSWEYETELHEKAANSRKNPQTDQSLSTPDGRAFYVGNR